MTTTTTNTLHCRALVGAPGSGKTTMMLDEIAAQPGRYILAAPRCDLLAEHMIRLQALAARHGTSPTLQTIHSHQGAHGAVGRRVAEAIASCQASSHVVLAITHAALLALDGALLAGWHVRIDEVPDTAVLSGRVCIRTSWPSLAAQYALEPAGVPGRSLIRPRADVDALPLSAVTSDVGQELVDLHRAIATPTRTVMVDIEAWADASLAGRQVSWWSIWSLDALAGCQSLVLTGASYVGSLLQRVMAASQRVTISLEEVGTGVRTGDPSIRIHYFTGHAGSTTWWQTDEGSRCLVEISRHLESIGFRGYWACNEAIIPYFRHRFGGAAACAPKQAGSNALRQHTTCAMIYSGKAQGGDEPIIDVLGLDRDDIRSAREDEDIFQFALRGAIRDADYGGSYDIYLYEVAQAERLRDRLTAQHYRNVVLVPLAAAGIMEVERPQPAGMTNAVVAQVSAAEQQEHRRLQERERGRRRRKASRDQRQADGTLRNPGRPKGKRDLRS